MRGVCVENVPLYVQTPPVCVENGAVYVQIPQRKTSETEPEQNGTPHDAAKKGAVQKTNYEKFN